MLAEEIFTPLPDHTQLHCEDGNFVQNFQEHPQSILLTSTIRPILDRLHPDGQYTIGQDSGIYWRLTEPPQIVLEFVSGDGSERSEPLPQKPILI